jgi:hypothetical protein
MATAWASSLDVMSVDALSHVERGVLQWVAEMTEPMSYDLLISGDDEPETRAVPRVPDRDVDRALQLLLGAAFIEGQRAEGDGTFAYWSGLAVRYHGLIVLGEWAPDNPEGSWRRRDAKVLARLAEELPSGLIATQPLNNADSQLVPGVSEADVHRSLRLLADAGYIDLHSHEADLHEVTQVTLSGRDALRATPEPGRAHTEPLAVARRSVETVGRRAWTLGMGDALEPLDDAQRRVVERFIERSRKLAESSLVRTEVRLIWTSGQGGMEASVEYAGDELVQAAVVPFRALYRDEEPASFKRVHGILRSQAADSPAGTELVELLDELGRGYRNLMQSAGPVPVPAGGLGGEGGPPLKTRQVIEDWLYGEHFALGRRQGAATGRVRTARALAVLVRQCHLERLARVLGARRGRIGRPGAADARASALACRP